MAKVVMSIRKTLSVLDEINDAVNHRHEKTGQSDAPKLYDLVFILREMLVDTNQDVRILREWRESYHNGPWNTGEKVNEWVKQHAEEHARIMKALEKSNK